MNQYVVNSRIEKVKLLLVDGYSRYGILEYSRKEWGTSRAQTDIYISKAKQRLREEYEPRREEELAKHIARREKIYQKAMETKDYWLALKTDQSLTELLGLTSNNSVVVLNTTIVIGGKKFERDKD